ncbi:hypothetical protein BY458DRAFT_505035 [Sporodiniella umbellata]|nr:hypothetical protein BY458DRAFT_505035 [Sporodiniella umbellata]
MLKDNLLDKHIEKLKKELKIRLHEGIWEPFAYYIGSLGCTIPILPTGGYFVWMKIPFDTDKLLEIIKKYDIQLTVGVGEDSQVPPDNDQRGQFYKYGSGERYIRLSFAHYDVPTLQEGIQRLRKAILLGLKKF